MGERETERETKTQTKGETVCTFGTTGGFVTSSEMVPGRSEVLGRQNHVQKGCGIISHSRGLCHQDYIHGGCDANAERETVRQVIGVKEQVVILK